jgi:hypothetical protein
MAIVGRGIAQIAIGRTFTPAFATFIEIRVI